MKTEYFPDNVHFEIDYKSVMYRLECDGFESTKVWERNIWKLKDFLTKCRFRQVLVNTYNAKARKWIPITKRITECFYL